MQPEPVYGQREPTYSARPPSPLRNSHTPPPFVDPADSDQDDDEDWGPERYHSTSPAASVTQFATNLAGRVNSMLMSPRSPRMLTDAELEADAERERDRSRREAERILTQEANDRKAVEDRVLALMHSTRGNDLPPPPPRSQTMPNPSGPPSPSSQKEGGGWWAAAKNKLTPTKEKEPLTPAQQVIQETKAREKEIRKNAKGREKEWQTIVDDRYSNPSLLNTPAPVQRKPVPTSPSSPTPFRPNVPTDLSPSPMHSVEARQDTGSPSREAPPLYAQFNGQGTLDLPGTLLVIAKRFEKLEKWTVGHVRALEERMSDVERWLVDKEKEKESLSTLDLSEGKEGGKAHATEELREMRDEIAELQGRVGELGREMAKMATAPLNLSSGPSRSPAIVSAALTPQTSSSADVVSAPAQLTSPNTPKSSTTSRTAPSSTARESTSPPLVSSGQSSARGYSRLPYPSGDYATPPDSGLLDRGAFASPTNSPPSSLSSTQPLNIPGLPSTTNISSSPSSYGSLSSGLPRTISSMSPSSDLPPPTRPADRPTSVSPTPRKRYTVALGGPIMDRNKTRPQSSTVSSSPVSTNDDDDESEDDFNDETIGKSTARLVNPYSPPASSSPSNPQTRVSPADRRLRTQSAYISPSPSTLSSEVASPSPSPATSFTRFRSRSTDRFGLGINKGQANGQTETGGVFSGGKFVDPLVLRKQEKEGLGGKGKFTTGGGIKKVPVGQLVAFFDGDTKE